MKRFILGLLTVLSFSTLRANDAATKPLVERLAKSKWGMPTESTVDPNLAWFILNPDMTTRSGWFKQPGWWKVDNESTIEAQVTKKKTRILTFNADMTEGTDQQGRKYRRLAPAVSTPASVSPSNATPVDSHALDFHTVAADRELWPQTVVLKSATVMPVSLNGKQVGSATLSAGTTVQLVAVCGDGTLTIAQNGDQAKVPVEGTNLMEAASIQQAKLTQVEAKQEEQSKLQEIQAKKAVEAAAKEKEAKELYKITKELHISVVQVIHGGVLADQMLLLSTDGSCILSGKIIFVEGVNGAAEGQQLVVNAFPNKTYSFTDVRGADRTVERWIINTLPRPKPTSKGKSKYSSPLDRGAYKN